MEPACKSGEELKEQWREVRQNHPHIRIREAAQSLGVSECELLATGCGESVVRLVIPWKDFFSRLAEVGPVLSLIRNPVAVHEKNCRFDSLRWQENIGKLSNDGFDLTIFLDSWSLGFAVAEQTPHGFMKSFQVFDRLGHALSKIYLLPDSNEEAYEKIIADYRSDDQSLDQPLPGSPGVESPRTTPPAADSPDLGSRPVSLETQLLEKFSRGRLVNLQKQKDRVRRVSPESLMALLKGAAEEKIPILIASANCGSLQIHRGPVGTVAFVQGWANVLDPDFNLHVWQADIHSAWVASDQTDEFPSASLELFTETGNPIAVVANHAHLEEADPEVWSGLIASLSE